jgi:hypothetical protein
MEENVNFNLPKSEEFAVYTDVVQLPSKGKSYAHGISEVTVEYMTATDENILTSENLIQTGKQFDVLLQRKIKTKGIKVDELTKGDKNAILLFLRKNAYGSDYAVKVRDPKTGEEFDEIVDLDKIKVKHGVMPDEDGLYTFELPISKKIVRFRILTDNEGILLKQRIDAKAKATNGIKTKVTDSLKHHIVSIDGNTDPMYINRFVDVMAPLDSLKLRVYITEVEPDLDLSYMFTNKNTGETFQSNVYFDITFFYPSFKL